MMLCGIKGANSVAKLLNSYLIRNFYGFYFEFYSTISRQGNNQASLPLLFWLIEMVGFHPTFSRHAKADASIVLVIWLNENVVFVSAKGNWMSKAWLEL